MSTNHMDENEERGEPLNIAALIENIPEEIREQLTDSDLHLLKQSSTLKEFRKQLMEVMRKLPDDLAPSVAHFEQMMQQFYAERKEEEKRSLIDMFARLRQSMVNLMQGSNAPPLMTPKGPAVSQEKNSGKENKGR